MPDITPRNPLRNYKFRVGFTDDPVGPLCGVKSVSGLNMTVQPFETWSGGNNVHRYATPNKITWDPITLEQGLALDDRLEQWAKAVFRFAKYGTKTSPPVKRELSIILWDEHIHGDDHANPPPSGPPGLQMSRRCGFRVYNAWISKYKALPKLDAMTSEVAFLSVEIIHEGWEQEILTSYA